MKDYTFKIIAALFFVFIAWFLFSENESIKIDNGKIHVKYWYATGQKEVQPYSVTKFNETQDSIFVEAVAIPWQESEKKILTAILSGNPPDVIDNFAPVIKWASRMALTPLDSLINTDGFDSTSVFPVLWQEMRWQDRVFAIPVWTTAYGFFYNKKLFKEAGLDPEKPPKTWDEVLEYSKQLTRRNDQGNLVQIGYQFYLGRTLVASQQAEDTPILMSWQKQIPFLSANGENIGFANKSMAGILNWIAEADNHYGRRDLDAFTAGYGYGDQHAFISEKCAMMVLGSSFPESIERFNPELDYGVSLIPSFKDTPTSSSTGSWWRAIPRGAKNKRAAWEFIKFCSLPSTQIESVMNRDENLFPANREAAADPRFLKNHADSIFYKEMEFAHSSVVVPFVHDVFWREFYNAAETAVYQIESAEVALLNAQNFIQNELNAALKYDKYVRANMQFDEVKR